MHKSLFAFKLLGLIGLAVFMIAAASLIKAHRPIPPSFCANSISCIKNLSGQFEENALQAEFMGKTFAVPHYIAQKSPENFNVLGEKTATKQIYVDLTTQHLYAFEDNKLVYDFPISSGKWGPTPTGSFSIWVKLRYTRMSGGNKEIGTYYNLPNVPYTMFFYNKDVAKSMGFSIHGAYWHDNFGHPMSHGCVNVKPENAEKLYEWANPLSTSLITYASATNPGTAVLIYGQPPTE